MRAVRLAFGSALVLAVAALAVTLSHSPIRVIRVSAEEHLGLGTVRQGATVCQPDEVLPRGTSAVRLWMFAFTGPRTTVTALVQGRVIAAGERGAGWTGGSVTVPIRPLETTRQGVTLCFALFLNGDEGVSLTGEPTNAALAAQVRGGPLRGRVKVEDLQPDPATWWSLIVPVARRMGLGRGAAGSWNALLVVGLMLALILITTRVVVRELK